MSNTLPAAAQLSGLRLLMVTPRYLPYMGGTEIHTHETAKRIAARNQVTVLTTDPSGQLPAEEWSDGIRILRVRAWPGKSDYYLAPGLLRAIKSQPWDIMHCQGGHTFVPPMAMLAALRSKRPYVVTFHSGGHSSRLRNAVRGLQWESLRPLLARAERLVGVSPFEASYFEHRLRLPGEKFVVISNGADLPDATEPANANDDQQLILSVGRLERYKGHHRVLAAMPYVLAAKPNAQLRIAGSGPLEGALRAQVSELGIDKHVQIGPTADRHEMANLLLRAGVVTLLSEYESQGIAVLEALKFKRPVIVADATALHEFAQRGLATAVPLDSSPEQIASQILAQLDHPVIPPDVELPSWDRCADQLLSLYHSIVGGTPCAS